MAFCLFYSGGVPCSSYPFSLFARVQIYKQIENTAVVHECCVDPPLKQHPQISAMVVGGKISRMRWGVRGKKIATFLIKKGNPCIVKLVGVEKGESRPYSITDSEYTNVEILRAIFQDLDERFEWLNSIAKESSRFRPSASFVQPEAEVLISVQKRNF